MGTPVFLIFIGFLFASIEAQRSIGPFRTDPLFALSSKVSSTAYLINLIYSIHTIRMAEKIRRG